MIPLRSFFNPITIRRLPTLILSSHHRYFATEKDNQTTEPQTEVGPSAPELQVNNLTGEHERK